jgi:hypothetical protein
MHLVKKIALVLAIILLVIAAVGYIFFPSHIHVERKAMINQKQSIVYNYVSNLKNYTKWSPWYQRDSTAKYTYVGPQSGVGATFNWESHNKDVGKGSLKIVEAIPDSLIRQDLHFMDQGSAKSSFTFTSEGNSTAVTWDFDVEAGANPLFRIMGGFMDGMIGKDFEKGLANLKVKAESIPVTDTVMIQ